MVVLVNRAKMDTATTGTGTITLGSASAGYQTFGDAGLLNAQKVHYVIEEGSSWEIGLGTYTSSGTTLSRSVIESSNADAAITLAGNAVVFVTAIASDLVRAKGADVASATELLVLTDGHTFDVTGTTTIATIEDTADDFPLGSIITLQFDGALTLTHGTDLILFGGQDLVTVAGDIAVFHKYQAGDWELVSFTGLATTTARGMVEKSTSAENVTGTATDKFPDVAGTKEMIDIHSTMVIISTIDLASDATASFTGFDATAYDSYIFHCMNVVPSSDASAFRVRTSSDGGSTYDSTSGHYSYATRENHTSSSADVTTTVGTAFQLFGNCGSAAGEDGVSGVLTILGPHLAFNTQMDWSGSSENSSGVWGSSVGGGVRMSAADVDAVQFSFSVGNLESGTITMYGVKNA